MSDANPIPVASVILPVYNGEEHLEESVNSVLSQEWEDLELILVEDGSTDSSWKIIEDFASKDPRVVPIRLAVNSGHAVASNTAIEAARGQFLARQDQDDIWLPARLGRSIEVLRQQPDVGFVSTSYYRLLPTGERLRRDPPRSHTSLRCALTFGNAICHAATTMRKSLRSTGELHYAPLPGPQDYDLWARLIHRTRALTIPEPLVEYRMHENSMSQLFAEEQPIAVQQISDNEIRLLLPDLDEQVDLESVRQLRRGELHLESARAAFPLLQAIWTALANEPGLDVDAVEASQRAWAKRASGRLVRHPSVAIKDPTFVAELLRFDPASPFRWAGARGRKLLGIGAS